MNGSWPLQIGASKAVSKELEHQRFHMHIMITCMNKHTSSYMHTCMHMYTYIICGNTAAPVLLN